MRSPDHHITTSQDVEIVFRRQSGQLVATLTRLLGSRHMALAEDAVQDALVSALQTWPFRGVPGQPAAWLYRVARNRALDRLRHADVADARSALVADDAPPIEPDDGIRLVNEAAPIADDELGLISLTCHPDLPPESRVALTLKVVGGFSVREIARAFLAEERAVAQRLVRAKRQLRESDVDFGLPTGPALVERLASMQASIYLMFNEGYAATDGDRTIREDVAGEAIRLGRLLAAHPETGTPTSWALVALMLLHAARFPARTGSDGELFLLRDQDRAAWDRALIADGMRAIDRASAGQAVSRYHLEAGIAACHAAAGTWADTNWPEILRLYDELFDLTGSAVVALNRAIARARIDGVVAGLADLERLATHPDLADYHLLPAAQGALWAEAGDPSRADEHYRRALALARAAPERRWLARRLMESGCPRL
jgi:RNA polymerase sigma-70 factor (ECF subfamily)